MDDEGYQVPQAENAIEERELENIKLDVRNLLIKATLPFKEELSYPHKDPETVDPKYFKIPELIFCCLQKLGIIFKRAPWSIKWASGVILDLIFLTDEKSIPDAAKEKLESIRYRRAFLSLQFLSFLIQRSAWARRELIESVDNLRDITSYLPALYQLIIQYAFKKRTRPVQELEMAHYWRCKLRFAIVEELNGWAAQWPDNKYLRLALQYARKKGFRKGAILSGEEVLKPKPQRRRARAASVASILKRDPKFDEAANVERVVLEMMDSTRLQEHIRSILVKADQSIIAIRECLDILFPPIDASNPPAEIQSSVAASSLYPATADDGNNEIEGDLFDEIMIDEFAATEHEMDQDFDDIQFDDDDAAAEPPAASSSAYGDISIKPEPAHEQSEEDPLNRSLDSQRSVSLEFRLDASGNAIAVMRKDTNAPAASSAGAVADGLFDDAIQPVLDSLQEEFRALERIYMMLYVSRQMLMESDSADRLQMAQDVLKILEDVDDVRVRCSIIGFIKPDSFVMIGGQILDAERGDAEEDEIEPPPPQIQPQLSISDVDADEKPPPAKRQKLTDGGIAAAAADAERVRAEEAALAGKVRRPRGPTKVEPKVEPSQGNNLHRGAPPPAPPAAAKKGRGVKPKSTPLQKLARKLGYKPAMSHGEKKSTNII